MTKDPERIERRAAARAAELLLAPLAPAGPLRNDLCAFAATLTPLFEGEPVLAAQPFALTIK